MSDVTHSISEGSFASAIDDLANQLCLAVDGDFDFTVKVDVQDDLIAKLQMLVNFLLHSARRSVRAADKLAYYDSLTKLPNRRRFQAQLKLGLEAAKRDGSMLGLLFVDLDHFKAINDGLGHSAGDTLLREVAVRLLSGVRSSDTVSRANSINSETVARIGGDEFTLLLPQLRNAQDAAKVAQRLLAMLSEPIVLEGQKVYTGASIGIAVFPTDGDNAETLLRNADSAMYCAKSDTGSHFRFYGKSMNLEAKTKLQLISRLHRALEHQEFILHYQPLRDTVTGALTAAEALVRWNAPDEGLVAPDNFIPIAEETGLIVPIGEWVLRTACAQARAWQDAGYRSIRMAVNVSAHQLRRPTWVQTVVQVLEDTGLGPAHLELELTESVIMQHDQAMADNMRALHAMGVGLSLDDFGTGYSSLSYLNRFPIGRLKIDRSFIREIKGDRDNAVLARAILALAKSLKLSVVAEGVETEFQAEFLREHGCDELQGYLLSRPVSAQDFYRFLEKEKNE